MWHLKTTTVSEIVGILGMVKKGANEHIIMIPTIQADLEF